LWLAHDEYDYIDDPNHISVTGLIKPVKQTILAGRVPTTTDPNLAALPELMDQVANRIGTAVHNAVENSWVKYHTKLLPLIRTPDRVIKSIKVNPDPSTVTEDDIPVYLEQRVSRKVGSNLISGKYDMVLDGVVRDVKTTKSFSYGDKGSDRKYVLQGSIYRWLSPDIIIADYMYIDFVFTDWMQGKTADPKYPQYPIIPRRLELLSLTETEHYITNKINQITSLMYAPEEDMPECTPEELWQTPSKFKYYKDPNKRTRSTKNFDSLTEANTRLATDGGVGIVVEVKGQVKACKYCAAFDICQQKNKYLLNGTLTI
jgi:hypothetical protein